MIIEEKLKAMGINLLDVKTAVHVVLRYVRDSDACLSKINNHRKSTSDAQPSTEDQKKTYFSVFNAVDVIPMIRKLRAENRVLKKKLDFIDELLKGLLFHNDNRVLRLINKKDYVLHYLDQTRDTLINVRMEADDILIKKHIIEVARKRAANHQDFDLPEVVHWLMSRSSSDQNGNCYDTTQPLDQQLPDLYEIADNYFFQENVVIQMKDIIDSIWKMVDKLLYDSLTLSNNLRKEGTPPVTRAPVFKEPSAEKLGYFDYYGYSPAGPIVPPLDLSWCSSPRKHIVIDNTVSLDVSPCDSPVFDLPEVSTTKFQGQSTKLPPITKSRKKKKLSKPTSTKVLPPILKNSIINMRIVFGRKTIA